MMNAFKRLVPGLVLLSLLGAPAFAQTRIATVDLQKVFDKYWKTEQASATLKERVTEMEKNHKELLDSAKKAKEEYQRLLEGANNQAVSAEERDRRKRAAEDKWKELKNAEEGIAQFERQATAMVSEHKTRLRKKLLEEIRQAINSKAKAAGYSLVIDAGAQTYAPDPFGPYFTPTLLYSSDENDLTEEVLSQLNAGAPVGETPKAEEKPAPAKDVKK